MSRFVPFAVALAACAPQAIPPASPPAAIILSVGAIETDAAGRCFARTAAPTQTNIVEETIEVVPELRGPDGAVVNPAVFRTVTRPRTVVTGEGQRFETVCPPVYTEAFVATLQRSLLIRRAYDGPITGQFDDATRLAVQQFQRADSIDSPLLAVRTARALGILAVTRG
ncbi:peptidoglycan-binding domain-containing protein [Loktanella sp. DJP18]|uniref:peptidoglycan-binding domain-containing protein n=1 Tax=Loktanella sp. DJP18 TaxID=3409788 RepID=UPI003BB5A635